MTPRGWWLFAAMALLWGAPYLFIKEAVDSFSPAAIVAGRTLVGLKASRITGRPGRIILEANNFG